MKYQKNNKTIGIIGGIGPQASSYLYERIMQLAQSKYGAVNNDDFPQIVLHSVPVPDFISNDEKIAEAMPMFQQSISGLDKVGVTHIAIASNTVHLLLAEFEKFTTTPFVSLIDAVVDRLTIDNRKKVGLLASPMTIRSGLYEVELSKEGITALYPGIQEQEEVENMIRAVLAGTNNGELKKHYVKVIQQLFDRGADALVLGCTELPLAINYEAINGRVYNSIQILAEKLVDIYYN